MLIVHRVGVVVSALIVPAFPRVLVACQGGQIIWRGPDWRGVLLNG